MASRILVTGSINMDLVVHSPRLPGAGETILGGSFSTTPGGKGANQAIAAARMGAQVSMLGRVGEDAFGDQMRQNLAAEGVDTRGVLQSTRTPSGVALITVGEQGENTIVVAAGANGLLSAQDLADQRPLFSNTDLLLVQLEIPLATISAALHQARQEGIRVVLTPAPAQPLADDLLAQVDWLTPNRSEALLLAGGTDLDAALNVLSGKVRHGVVITMGVEGVLWATSDRRQGHMPAFPVTAVDTVGAGDAFTAGFSVGLAEGQPVIEAIRLGQAAAAISVTRRGAQSCPTRKEAEAFLATQPSV